MSIVTGLYFKTSVTIQSINIFQLPLALAGEIWRNIVLALAKKYIILANANKNHPTQRNKILTSQMRNSTSQINTSTSQTHKITN